MTNLFRITSIKLYKFSRRYYQNNFGVVFMGHSIEVYRNRAAYLGAKAAAVGSVTSGRVLSIIGLVGGVVADVRLRRWC